MADEIRLIGLRATGHHGVFAHERTNGQEFVVDLVVGTEFAAASSSDLLARTVDYGMLAGLVHTQITGEPVQLIETLAENIATAVLRHENVKYVEVSVHKPHAPISVPFEDVIVWIRRERT